MRFWQQRLIREEGKARKTERQSDTALQEVAPARNAFNWEHEMCLRRRCDWLRIIPLEEQTGEAEFRE